MAHFLDLLVADISLDVGVEPRVSVGDNERLGRKGENFFEASRIDVGEIDNDAERIARLNEIASKAGQTIRRRTARRKNSAGASCIGTHMSEPERTHAALKKNL